VAEGWDASSRWDPLHGGLDYLLVFRLLLSIYLSLSKSPRLE
jgi:hypothetical protein